MGLQSSFFCLNTQDYKEGRRRLYTRIPLYLTRELAGSTTVKVSKETVRRLAALQRSLQAKSMDETIEILVKRRRKEALDSAFGSDLVKSRKFKEDDRLEHRG